MDAAPQEPIEPETTIVVAQEPVDATGRLLSGVGLALAALALLELLGTMTVGLAVKTSRLNFASRQGYAFLTQLEKSPVGLMLVLASLAAAVAMLRTRPDGRTLQLSTLALWAVIVASVLLGVGTVLAVLARFRVGELAATQKVDALTRRVLVVFVIRNFGTAVTALLVAVGAVFGRRPRTPDVV
ncbi:MAG: hypothetical protein QOJ00_2114 [Actinomycetota bacterium]|jgi:hypothetical protein